MLEEETEPAANRCTNSAPSRVSWSRRATSVKTLASLESSIQQGQQQLSEMRANESRLRGRIAQAAAAAKRGRIAKPAKRRMCAIASRKPRVKAPPTNLPKANAR